ncbi:MAG: tetratricopeptide repeat protein [Phycisphaerae bacterium]|nr:tetratricopeptide repeat protein [Phycisphaerae bacterium]
MLKTTSTGAATQFIAAAARGVASGAGTISEEAILPGAGRLGALLAEEPELVDAFLTLPQTERDAELFAALESAVRAALSHHPEYADLRHYAACVQSRLGRLERAVEFERAALAINPGYVAARVQLGRTLAGLNRLEEAIVEFEQAVAQGGDYADVYFELGELHRQAGHTSEARQAYERALRLNQSFDRAQRALQSMAAA